jgi:hypothetical protein
MLTRLWKGAVMEPQSRHTPASGAERWIALSLCAAMLASAALETYVRTRAADAGAFAARGVPLAAATLSAAGLLLVNGGPRWARALLALRWSGLFLMVWAANGLPFDLLRLTPLIPLPVDVPRLVTKTLAFAAAVVLARLALARRVSAAAAPPATWYGYAACVLALPYPIFRTCWAMGGTLGLRWPGAGGQGWAPWLLTIPWLLAAALSLLLVPAWRWMPRRLMLTAGWLATGIVAMIGPAACWSLIRALLTGSDRGPAGIAVWVFGLFYGSWLLWAVAAGAATRSYQLRTAGPARLDVGAPAGPGA